MKRNRLKITMESRIHGDVYVRFGGERLETYRPKGRQGALRLACEATRRLKELDKHIEMMKNMRYIKLNHRIDYSDITLTGNGRNGLCLNIDVDDRIYERIIDAYVQEFYEQVRTVAKLLSYLRNKELLKELIYDSRRIP